MSGFDGVLGAILTPLGVPTVLFLLLLVAMRWSFPFSRAGGVVLLLGVVALAAGLVVSRPALLGLAGSPDVAPALVLALGSAVFTWTGVRDLRRRSPGEGAVGPWAGPERRDLVVATLGIVALVLLAALVPIPPGSPADPAVPPDPVRPPWWAAGWMELSSVVRPALALALLSLIALAALPWLGADPEPTETDPASTTTALDERRYGIRLFLFGWWILGVGPIVVGSWLRGSGWRRLGPDGRPIDGEIWSRSLAEWFWIEALESGRPASPLLRELPGLVLATLGIVATVLLMRRGRGRGIVRRYRRSIGGPRFAAGVVLVLGMLLLAAKIWLLEVLRLRALIDLPELGVSF